MERDEESNVADLPLAKSYGHEFDQQDDVAIPTTSYSTWTEHSPNTSAPLQRASSLLVSGPLLPRWARPSLADELLPIPVASPHGATDSLARAVRRSGALAIIIFFLVAITYLLATEGTGDRQAEAAARAFRTLFQADTS